MKQFILLFSLGTLSMQLSAQTLAPDVIATSGTSFTDGTSQLDWTLGEPVTATLISGSSMITQGFHQPDLLVTSVTDAPADYSVTVFPNPTIESIQLQFQDLKENVIIELHSVDGKLLQSKQLKASISLQLDLSNYAAGTYLLSVKDDHSKIKTFQVIKSH
jgi:hypothetical protein